MILPVLLGFLAFIHLLPAMAALSPKQIERLYGVDAEDRVLKTLLQHRAVLLGLVGLAFAVAIVVVEVRWLAVISGTISMVTFLIFAALQGTLNGPLRKIVIVDAIGLPLAAAAIVLVAIEGGGL